MKRLYRKRLLGGLMVVQVTDGDPLLEIVRTPYREDLGTRHECWALEGDVVKFRGHQFRRVPKKPGK